MRLINTKTLETHEFLPAYIPRYAILSHRWQEEEVSFKQYSKRHKYPEIQRLRGFTEIEQFCRIARERQTEWAWIDTCCIDSRSSAELSEAINSMWRWYKGAAECYVYLCDVHTQELSSDVLAQVEKSEWFTRGWTLQELIAPGYRVFFTSEWNDIGTIDSGGTAFSQMVMRDSSKIEDSSVILLLAISRTSKVPFLCLQASSVKSFSIGERLSWSANRTTSRPEDVAYSLMGLLDVNMPLLYGEGKQKAFTRLQLELLKKSNDTSLFAWQYPRSSLYVPLRRDRGLLASSPAKFANFRHKRSPMDDSGLTMAGKNPSLIPYEMTNRGLYLHVGCYRIQSRKIAWLCVLWCVPLLKEGTAIFLEHAVGQDPKSSPVSARRTSLIEWDVLSPRGRLLLEGAQRPISVEDDLDASCSLVYLAEDQRGKLDQCEFYIEQDHL
ncbi:hypothetical protein KC360_g5392 [Hortaea werneckii]|nr:hypothetical protein KC325_g6530 [Hortaea werneckii]KAI6992298.1 hypothetical protein KC359_g5753 [Hortaea werneckii]KAI7144825.1 hypothetical protein KC344_g5062 [Hortaea werneckii]KAI7172620.1 hypothetical protein KC360_g5392 [Hortaea werneckii]